MIKLFKITGIIGMIFFSITLIVEFTHTPMSAFIGFFRIVFSLALFTLGKTIERVDFLKDSLKRNLPDVLDYKVTQNICFQCGSRYSREESNCPSCGSASSLKI